MALQRQRRKRDRRKREDDDRVIRLEDQQRGQQDGDRGEGGEEERDQEGHARKQDEDEEPRQQEEGTAQEEEDEDREPEDREPSSEDESRDRDQRDDDEDREERRSEPLPALEILDAAKDQLTVLTGRVPDSVSGLRRSDNGWRLKLDMVELERIPPSTSVMATYEVELDRDGNVVGYEQERRFVRGQVED